MSIRDEHKDKQLLYFDESRFGTHSKAGRFWCKKGVRNLIKTKLGFENSYLYSSVNPKTGEHFTLLLPYVNTQCMNVYLEYLSTTLQADNAQAVLIMDGAGWHKSKELVVPKNIIIELLPPYCPELNPVERLWRYIKDHTIKNKVFDNLNQLEKNLCEFLRNLETDTIKSICAS